MAAAQSGYEKSAGYPDLNWKFRVLVAEARIRSAAYSQALEILQPEPPPQVPKEVLWRRTLTQAYSLCFLKKQDESDAHFQEASVMQAGGVGSKAELAYLQSRCELARHENEKAESYLRIALDAVKPSEPFIRIYILQTLGWIAAQDARNEEAVAWYSESLAIVETLHAPILQERAMGSLASNYAELGDFANAQKYAEEAEKIASQQKMLSDEQRWLLNIGQAHQHRNEIGVAEESYNRALAIGQQLNDSEISATCLHNLTGLKLYEGQLAAAEKYHQAALDLGLHGGDALNYLQLDSASISSAHQHYSQAVMTLQTLLQQIEDGASAGKHKISYRMQWLVQAALARNYAAQGDANDAGKWFQRSIATVEEAAKHMRHQEFATAMRDNLPVYDDYITFLIAQRQPERALQIAQLGRARTLMQDGDGPRKSESPRAWLARIHEYLRRNNTVLLSYFATDKECYLWTVNARKMKFSSLGISGPQLDVLIDSYRREIQTHTRMEDSSAASKLFQSLVQPALDMTPRGSHVMILADSKIYSVDFGTLVSPHGGKHYWIEDVDIQNVSSIDLLLQRAHTRPASKDLLLIGAPAQADPHFVELPNAPQEMESVRRHFSPPEVTSISGKDATPDSYLKGGPGEYRYIHLATHGSANAMEPLKSAIILSARPNGDFKLLAQDIISPRLHLNAKLVTISACEGAGTNVQSLEGLVGLEWAFLRAGAHQVVAALWDVDDSITPQLVDDFYAQLKQGKSASEALRHSKLELLKAGGKYATPYYWAPLQLYTGS